MKEELLRQGKEYLFKLAKEVLGFAVKELIYMLFGRAYKAMYKKLVELQERKARNERRAAQTAGGFAF